MRLIIGMVNTRQIPGLPGATRSPIYPDSGEAAKSVVSLLPLARNRMSGLFGFRNKTHAVSWRERSREYRSGGRNGRQSQFGQAPLFGTESNQSGSRAGRRNLKRPH